MMTIALQPSSLQQKAVDAACLWNFFSKGRVLDSMLEDYQSYRGNKRAHEVRGQLNAAKRRRAALFVARRNEISTDVNSGMRQQISILENEIDKLESELSMVASRHKEARRASTVTLKDVRSSIPEGATLPIASIDMC